MARKTGKEARAERVTWFALILIFIPLNFGNWMATIPAFMFPLAVATVLIFSGIYQWRHDWRVSPIVWMIAAIMLLVGLVAMYIPDTLATYRIDPMLLALIATIVVIVFGVLSNES
jgi:peptidoglycan/LPS O-acetylase OafA/YrhL